MADKTGGAATVSSADTVSMITLAVTYVACSTHPEEILTNFCQTCKVFTCGVCFDEKHESHICSSAKKQLMLMEQEVENHLQKLKDISDEQHAALLEVKSSRDQQRKELADGLKAREQKETDAIADLDRQKEALIAQVENVFEKKKLEMKQVLTDSKCKLQASQDERIATLDASSASMTNRCSQLKSVIRNCEQIRASESVSQNDLYQVFPELQEQLVLPVQNPPPAFESSEALPNIDIGKTEDHLLLLLKGRNILQHCIAGVKPVTDSDQSAVFVKKSVLNLTCQTLKTDEACQREDLVAVSASSAESLIDLLGESVTLRREDQGNGKKVLKQAQAGPITHVLATVQKTTIGLFRSTYYAYLPINMPINQAVKQALGFQISKAQIALNCLVSCVQSRQKVPASGFSHQVLGSWKCGSRFRYLVHILIHYLSASSSVEEASHVALGLRLVKSTGMQFDELRKCRISSDADSLCRLVLLVLTKVNCYCSLPVLGCLTQRTLCILFSCYCYIALFSFQLVSSSQ